MKLFKTLLSTAIITVSSATWGATYYVKNGGDDSADGKSHATAWATIGRVNSAGLKTSDDVYFHAGDTFTGVNLKIKWGGTADDRAIVGAYYVQDGKEKHGVPRGGKKPNLRGGYTVPFTLGNVPASEWVGMVAINKVSYVTVRDLFVSHSSGFGISISGVSHNIVENNRVDHVAQAGIYSYRGAHHIIRKNVITRCGQGNKENIMTDSSHPPCIGGASSDFIRITGNKISDTVLEGITLRLGTNKGIIRNNKIYDLRRVALYIQGAESSIIERNLVVNSSRGVEVVTEGRKGFKSNNSIIRNNILSGVGLCFATEVWDGAVKSGSESGGWFVGNTCTSISKRAVRIGTGRFSSWEIANNIFWDADKGTGLCTAHPHPTVTMHHNSWDAIPDDVDCRGNGDIYGDPKLSAGNFDRFSGKKPPKISDYKPVRNSPVIKQGRALAKLTHDINQVKRASRPSMGAVEPGGAQAVISKPTGLSLQSPPAD